MVKLRLPGDQMFSKVEGVRFIAGTSTLLTLTMFISDESVFITLFTDSEQCARVVAHNAVFIRVHSRYFFLC